MYSLLLISSGIELKLQHIEIPPNVKRHLEGENFKHNKTTYTNNRFFLFGRHSQKIKADNRGYTSNYRLCVLQFYGSCVFASGSLIILILNFFAFTKVSFLHLGQKRGKFLSSVSSRNFILVLLLHIGHSTH